MIYWQNLGEEHGEPPSRKGQGTAEPEQLAPANGAPWAPLSNSSFLLSARLLCPRLPGQTGSPAPQAICPQARPPATKGFRVDHVTASAVQRASLYCL